MMGNQTELEFESGMPPMVDVSPVPTGFEAFFGDELETDSEELEAKSKNRKSSLSSFGSFVDDWVLYSKENQGIMVQPEVMNIIKKEDSTKIEMRLLKKVAHFCDLESKRPFSNAC